MGIILKSIPASEPYGASGNLRLQALYECPVCGSEFKALCSNVDRGNTTKCVSCARKDIPIGMKEANDNRRDLAASLFIARAFEMYGDSYDYTNTIYINSSTKVAIRCKVHNAVFYVLPSNHLKYGKGGCPMCANEARLVLLSSNSKTIKEEAAKSFIGKAKTVHGDKYDYSKVLYAGSGAKVIIICPIHGEFLQTPNGHISGKCGCPTCGVLFERPGGTGKYNIKDSGIVYLVELKELGLYKIGITKNSVEKRLKTFGDIVVHHVEIFQTIAQAYAVEQYLLRTVYANIKYNGPKVTPNGNTELLVVAPKAFSFWVQQAILETIDEVNIILLEGDL